MNLLLLVILKKTYFFIFNEYLEQLKEYVLVQNEIKVKLILKYMYSRQKLVCIFLCCRHDTTIFKQRKYKSNYSPDQMTMGQSHFSKKQVCLNFVVSLVIIFQPPPPPPKKKKKIPQHNADLPAALNYEHGKHSDK